MRRHGLESCDDMDTSTHDYFLVFFFFPLDSFPPLSPPDRFRAVVRSSWTRSLLVLTLNPPRHKDNPVRSRQNASRDTALPLHSIKGGSAPMTWGFCRMVPWRPNLKPGMPVLQTTTFHPTIMRFANNARFSSSTIRTASVVTTPRTPICSGFRTTSSNRAASVACSSMQSATAAKWIRAWATAGNGKAPDSMTVTTATDSALQSDVRSRPLLQF
mmetsp:Transcript_8635/g.24357  ORF Transcript_8635/g.24357 Transcript_8635/m.24357 type:complete len:215 (+) Transcript_8635:252-896(+)